MRPFPMPSLGLSMLLPSLLATLMLVESVQAQDHQHAAGAAVAAASPFLPAEQAPAGARVYFLAPKNGDTVASPVTVVFGLAGMGVAPAGMQKDGTGHHHLLIDSPTIDYRLPLPSTAQIVHFGGGQTQASVELAPGTHTLQLLLGDWKHQPHATPVQSETITITVK